MKLKLILFIGGTTAMHGWNDDCPPPWVSPKAKALPAESSDPPTPPEEARFQAVANEQAALAEMQGRRRKR